MRELKSASVAVENQRGKPAQRNEKALPRTLVKQFSSSAWKIAAFKKIPRYIERDRGCVDVCP